MSSNAEILNKVIPAQLSFLAIYNPSLGPTDETFRDQVVFYYSRAAHARRKEEQHDGRDVENELREEENEKLRQIGLAQGMVGFARSFANGESMDSVETEKSRIVLNEVERGWWILASIDLTRLPVVSSTPPSKTATSASSGAQPSVEYSSREVSPPDLLVQQLLRAHRIFRLHHGPSLSVLYNRLQRTRFCSTLDRYWTRFATNWDVLLHGNPAVDIYQGTKLASGGELGIGVGEEEWGSGEREVFEDFAGRTDGLVDLVVSRFGEASSAQKSEATGTIRGKKSKRASEPDKEPWMGMARSPGPSDGVVFSGVGAISKSSLMDVADWVQSIYSYGEHAYGVRENPGSERRKRRRKEPLQKHSQPVNGHVRPPTRRERTASTRDYPTIPPPIVAAAEQSLDRASAAADAEQQVESAAQSRTQSPAPDDRWTKYLTLGYGSAWGPGSGKAQESSQRTETPAEEQEPGAQSRAPESSMHYVEPEPEGRRLEDRINAQIRAENSGHFIIGLKGDMDDDVDDESVDEDAAGGAGSNSRTMLRMLHLEVLKPAAPTRQLSSETQASFVSLSGMSREYTRLRVVVYVHRPFIYTFLFHPRTDSLAMSSFYRNLHIFFAPLHKPLSASTDPVKVAARMAAASPLASSFSQNAASAKDAQQQPIFDLVYDPDSMLLHTSIPNVPDPGTLGAEGLAIPGAVGVAAELPPWTRVEALNVHSQILTTVSASRRGEAEGDIEKTAKTSRGWWVVWMRVPAGHPDEKLGLMKGDLEGNMPAQGRLGPPKQQGETASTAASGSMLLSGTSQTMLPPSGRPAGGRDLFFDPPALPREAILIRRARDAASGNLKSGARTTSGIWTLGLGGGGTASLRGSSSRDDHSGGGAAAGWGPARLSEGIGVDARKYVEGLLSLNR